MSTEACGPDREAIRRTHAHIQRYIRRTPVLELPAASLDVAGAGVTLKLELTQCTGSFKCRGAFANLLQRAVPAAGVVAASGGNHGAAVAYAARELNVPARIYVPAISSPVKIKRIESYAATLVVGGEGYAEALAASEAWLAEAGAMSIHAFDQMETLQGQGTVALEMSEQAPALDTVLVAVGGGGLIGGIASWYRKQVRVVAVEPRASPTLHRALAAGKPVEAETGGVAADSLSPKRVGELVFPIAEQYVAESCLVSDDAIVDAQRRLWELCRIAAEPGGATAFAALSSGAYRPAPDERVGVIVSGGNTAAVNFD